MNMCILYMQYPFYTLIYGNLQTYEERFLWTMNGRMGRNEDTGALNMCLNVEDPHEGSRFTNSGPNGYISERGGGTVLHRDAILAATNSLIAGTFQTSKFVTYDDGSK